MNAADVFILPYRDILNSGSVHLGISFGLPIVAPQLGCIPEVLAPENEFLYDPAESDGLIKAIKSALNHQSLDDIGEANFRRAKKQNWDRTAERLIDVYNSTIDGGRTINTGANTCKEKVD
jgi:glycosyltransferase involved in cell wall biosynthesis